MSQNLPSLRNLLTTGPRRVRARHAVRLVTPVGVELLLMSRRNRKRLERIDASIARDLPPAETRVEEAIRFLVARGLDEGAVRAGSMAEPNLNRVGEVVSARLPRDRPLCALHVGNFVGVSLCYFSWLVRERHPDSLVVSVDPNITHRGIETPQAHVLALLHHFGLLGNNLIIPGYSLAQTAGETINERFETDYLGGLGCENVLASLGRLCGRRFDLVLLDGNHSEAYLAAEFAAVRSLLADSGIVVFDDVEEDRWPGVTRVFRQVLQDTRVMDLSDGGRVGIIQVDAPRAAVAAADR